MNPYEKTVQELKKQSEGPKRFAQKAIGLGATAAGASFAPVLAKAAPFLSQYIPQQLAIKGLSKINPKFGKFIDDALNSNHEFEEVKDFIGSQVEKSQEQPKDERNVIEKYSPGIYKYIEQLIKGGSKPAEAALKAKKFLDEKEQKIIKQMEKDNKVDWVSLVESIFGGGNAAQPPANSTEPQQSNQGSIDPGLAQILQQGQALLQKFKGG